ncbi:MAG: glycerophosphodiester phosphodiesterase [Gemmatimonadetes bacterium]|nr:glycerophosphodiester phosphodiesterase [Gemmatimonadota bacterium]
MLSPIGVWLTFVLIVSSTPLHTEQDPKILVMAHRGGLGLWPENTIYGYREALRAGVDVLEIDVWRTSDDVIVVNHDRTVDRTTDGSGPVRAATLSELKALDAGYRWSIEGSFPYRGQGHVIPTLAEVLTEFPEARFNIDLKENSDTLINGVCDLITKHGAQNRVMIASFHQSALVQFRDHCPGVATSAGRSEIIRFLFLSKLGLGGIYQPNFQAFQVPVRVSFLTVVSPSFVRAAHDAGVEVHPWTVNDPEEMKRLIDMGVDGIITDYPDRLSEILGH